MYFFFAMSGFGLVVSYLRNEKYIKGFLNRQFPKLYVPYILAFVAFTIYRSVNDISMIEVLNEKGICGLVPTSWYIFVLSLFYVFFYVVFRYCKASTVIKVLFVSVLVFCYYVVAIKTGVSYWRYYRCPAFAVGMFFGCFDDRIRKILSPFGAVVMILFMLLLTHYFSILEPMTWAAILFFVIYIIKQVPNLKIVHYLSKMSLEMFIIQSIPISFVIDNIHITNTCIVAPFVIALDILLAQILQVTAKCINRRLI